MRLRFIGTAILLFCAGGCLEVEPGDRSGSRHGGGPADNGFCFVCHGNYRTNEFVNSHAAEGVGCATCHGPSEQHCEDEAHLTPPDVMFTRVSVNPACTRCHERPELKKQKHRFENRAVVYLDEKGPERELYCTDCHGKDHRLAKRDVRWNRLTREVMEKPYPPRDEPGKAIFTELAVDPDAVTRATPGYSRGVTPPHLRCEVRRAPFMMPVGTVNLARSRPVRCSDESTVIGDPAQITDGLMKSDEFHFVELGPGLDWVQIDLGAVRTIQGIVVWHYYRAPVIYNDVVVRIADEPSFQHPVTLFNNDHDNSSGLGRGSDPAFYSRWWGEIIDARGGFYEGTPARYVRVYTADGVEGEPTRFVEVAVYGRDPAKDGENTVTCSDPASDTMRER